MRDVSALVSRVDALRAEAEKLRARLDASDDRYLRTAVKHPETGKMVLGHQGEDHGDLMHKNGIKGEWDNPKTTGFVNHQGHFLSRSSASHYAYDNDLLTEVGRRAHKVFRDPVLTSQSLKKREFR